MKKQLLLSAALLSVFAGNVCAQADGDYYLYDAANKVFLSRGGSWGTEATADKSGVPFTWTSSDGHIIFKDWAKVGLHIENNGTTVYTDNANPTTFTFVTTDGGYYLQNAEKSSYARHDTGTYKDSINMITDASKATVWTLKTKDERDAIIKTFPTENITNVITAAGLTGVTAENFETTLSTNYAAKTVLNLDPKTFTWTEFFNRGGTVSSDSPREAYQRTGKFDYTATGLTKGIYKITTSAFERNGKNADCVTMNASGYNITTSSLTANKEQVRIKGWAEERKSDTNPNSVGEAKSLFDTGSYANSVYTYVGDDGQLDLSVVTPSYLSSHWFIFGNTVVTYYNDTMSEEDANKAIDDATALLKKPMEEGTKTELSNALNAFNAAKTIVNYNIMNTKMTAANTSVDAYASGKAALDAIKAVMDGTNVYTQSAYKTYSSLYSNNLPLYNNHTWATTAAAALVNPSKATGWHAENDVDDFLMSAWGAVMDWDNLHVNTWSGEGDTDGSNFMVPFYEYWTEDAKILGAKTISATLSGLEAGAYKASACVRVRNTNNKTMVNNGITLNVNSGEGTDVTTATQIGTSQLHMDTFDAYGRVADNGNLNITFNVAANSNVSWLAFKNVKYEKIAIHAMNENSNNTITATANASVDLARTIKANTWNTIVLPFSLTDAQVKAAFGSDAQVAAFSESSVDANHITINLNTTSEGITANVPALIKTTTAGTTYTFDNVNIVAGDPIATGTNVDFVGSYNASTTVEDGNYFLSDNKIYPSTGATTIDGFRAYFKVKNGVSNAATINLNFDGNITTGMNNVNTVSSHKNAVRYNLNGQRISSATKGLYIEDGKKIVK